MSVVSGYRDPHETQGRVVCRFFQRGMCRFGSRCRNVHNDATHTPKESNAVATNQPNDQSLSSQTFFTASSTRASTAISSTSSTACGICLETVMERTDNVEQTFGILPNCNHCFCFACIRKWRNTKEFDSDVSKACPECRRPSDYVYRSKKWFDVPEEKDTFIKNEKTRMQKTGCKYFKKGRGYCPFGNTCLYLHALRDRTLVDVGPPLPRRRHVPNLDPELLPQGLQFLSLSPSFLLSDDEIDIEDYDQLVDYDDYGSEDDYDEYEAPIWTIDME